MGTSLENPPDLIFTDLFTGLGDGDYTLYCNSQTAYRNLEVTIEETFVPFELLAGIIQPRFPNEALNVQAVATVGGNVLVTWNYIDTNQGIVPTSFEVYVDAALDTSVTYAGAKGYSLTIGPLTETTKVIKVTAKAGTSETNGDTDSVDPDSTPPASVPFTFQIS